VPVQGINGQSTSRRLKKSLLMETANAVNLLILLIVEQRTKLNELLTDDKTKNLQHCSNRPILILFSIENLY
jgi:hypothetical protein